MIDIIIGSGRVLSESYLVSIFLLSFITCSTSYSIYSTNVHVRGPPIFIFLSQKRKTDWLQQTFVLLESQTITPKGKYQTRVVQVV